MMPMGDYIVLFLGCFVTLISVLVSVIIGAWISMRVMRKVATGSDLFAKEPKGEVFTIQDFEGPEFPGKEEELTEAEKRVQKRSSEFMGLFSGLEKPDSTPDLPGENPMSHGEI